MTTTRQDSRWLTRLPAAAAVLLLVIAATPPAAAQSTAPAVFADVNKALETQRIGVPYKWRDPRRRQSGTIIVRRTYYRGSQPCRDYTRTTEVGGTLISTTSGTGCRIGDGIWSLTEQPTEMSGASPPAADSLPGVDPAAEAEDAGAVSAADPPVILPPPGRKPVLIFASRPTPSDW